MLDFKIICYRDYSRVLVAWTFADIFTIITKNLTTTIALVILDIAHTMWIATTIN